MYISGPHRKVYFGNGSHSSQSSVDSIEKVVFRDIVSWLYPFSFEDSPEGFGNIEVRGIGRKEKQEESSLFPDGPELPYNSAAMTLGIVKDHKGLLFNFSGECFKVVGQPLGGDGICGCETLVSAPIVHHPVDVEASFLFGRDVYLLTREFPPVRDITFGASMCLISKIQINATFIPLLYKLLQLLALIRIELRRGLTLGTFPYTSKSCANADKKFLKVLLLASLPVAACHLCFAFIRLSRSFSIASLTAVSSEESMIGLAPCPGLFRRPASPFSRYRLTQRLTIGSETDKAQAISLEERPSDFINIIWLRFCMKALGSNSTVYSNSTFCLFVRVNSVILIVTLEWQMFSQKYMYNNF